MEITTEPNRAGAIRRARDWPLLLVTGLALLFSGVPQPEIAALEWGD